MKAEANLYIHSLSKLMRRSLKFSRCETISLTEEIAFLREYMILEQMRFESLFDFRIKYNENIDKNLIQIPALVIQPLVENAIKHAFKGMKSGGKILIDYRITEKIIHVTVTDNGKGMNSKEGNKSKDHQSVGLEIVRQRLNLINEKLNINKAGIQIKSSAHSGTSCLITLPIIKYES